MTEEHHAFARSHAQPGPLQIRYHDLVGSASAFTCVHQSVRQSAHLCRSPIVSKPVEANATQQPASSLCWGCVSGCTSGSGYTTAKLEQVARNCFRSGQSSTGEPNALLPNGNNWSHSSCPGTFSATTIFGGRGLDANRSRLERTTIFGVDFGVDVAVVRPGKGAKTLSSSSRVFSENC